MYSKHPSLLQKYATPLEVILKKNGSTVGDCVNFGSSSCCNPPAVASDEKQGCLPSKRASATLLWQ